MHSEITVIDYGLGNLYSVGRALEKCEARYHFSSDPDEVRVARRLILPGVGAFGQGMQLLRQTGLDAALKEAVHAGAELLGICLGMQMLLEESEEFGQHQGLALMRGKVLAIPDQRADGSRLKTPHIGWNELLRPEAKKSWSGTPLSGLREGTPMYFVHSYMAVPTDSADRVADCLYGETRVSAVIGRENLWGMQFHPEKSGPAGLLALQSFLERR